MRIGHSRCTRGDQGIVDEFTAHEFGEGFAWNKLYKKELFDYIKYQEGRVYEDLATTHKLVHRAECIFMLPNYLYTHKERKNSISHTHLGLTNRDNFQFIMQRYIDLCRYGFDESKLKGTMCSAAIRYLSRTRCSNDDLYLIAQEIVDSIESVPTSFNWKQRIALYLWKKNKKLFCWISRLNSKVGL